MANDEIAARKNSATILFGLGLASFVAACRVPEDTGIQLAIGAGFVLFGVGFVVAAAKFAKSVKAASGMK